MCNMSGQSGKCIIWNLPIFYKYIFFFFFIPNSLPVVIFVNLIFNRLYCIKVIAQLFSDIFVQNIVEATYFVLSRIHPILLILDVKHVWNRKCYVNSVCCTTNLQEYIELHDALWTPIKLTLYYTDTYWNCNVAFEFNVFHTVD